MQNFMLNLFQKIYPKNIKYSRSLLDPENYQCDHLQPYNFFLVFVDFWTLPDNSEKLKSVDSKQKN